jgi:hypothetical protein
MIDLIFRMFGLNTRSEVRIAAGRIDTLVETRKYVYCFEFKMDSPRLRLGNDRGRGGQSTTKDAIDQIGSKEYLTPWAGSGKQCYKIGVVFDFAKRNISEWEIA